MKQNLTQQITPPQSVEIEKTLLRNILTVGTAAMDDVSNILRSDQIFYKSENQELYRIIRELYRRGITIDIFTVQEEAVKQKLNISDYVLDIFTEGPSLAISEFTNADYINILQQKYVRRRSIQAYYELGQKLFDESLQDAEAYYVLEKAYQEMADIINGRKESKTTEEVMIKSIEKLNERIEIYKSGKLPGINTGFKNLNNMIAGWQGGELYVIGARPGMGKTAIAINFAESAARYQNPVLFFSLEMADYKLTDRMLIGESEVESGKYRHGKLTQDEYENIVDKAKYLSGLPIQWDEKSGIDIDYIVSASRLAVRKKGIRIIIIDYLQLIDMKQRPGESRDEAIGNVTRKLKQLSKELDIPVILLSQLNRSVESRSSKEPSISDLRESGNIEQDADVILLLFRPAYYGLSDYRDIQSENVLWILTEKNRNGDKYDIPLLHNKNLTKFEDYGRGSF